MSGAFARNGRKICFSNSDLAALVRSAAFNHRVVPNRAHCSRVHARFSVVPRYGVSRFASHSYSYSSSSSSSSSASSLCSPSGVVGWYLGMIKSHPVLTKSITCGGIYMAADVSSQGFTLGSSEPFDLLRTIRMGGYGMLVAGPSLHFWFNFISRVLPKRDTITTLKKIFIGQATYGPVMTVTFFSLNAALQGESGSEIIARLKRDLLPTLKNGLLYWPMCDFITFKFIPVHLQPLEGFEAKISCSKHAPATSRVITLKHGQWPLPVMLITYRPVLPLSYELVADAELAPQNNCKLSTISGLHLAIQQFVRQKLAALLRLGFWGACMLDPGVDYELDRSLTSVADMFNATCLCYEMLSLPSDRIFSQEIPSDVTVNTGETTFSLHKFPLVSKCGYIRKLVSGASDADLAVIEVPDIPGGDEAFELAAKFCYGINFEISIDNIAMLCCAAEYLEMTEDYAVGNLVSRTEAYLNEVALKNLSGAVTVLRTSESLLPMAEKVKLVSRCIDTIAYMACKESQLCLPARIENSHETLNSSVGSHPKTMADWWAEDLIVLRIDIFQRVIMAMIARGFKQYALGPILMLYAQKSLRGLETFGKGRKKIDPKQEHEKRVVLETIVSLLPREKNTMSVHPSLSDMEKKKVCSLMDCQKLSREACAHAAQNDRLPVQTVVQVLYYEQQRLREVMDGGLITTGEPQIHVVPQKLNFIEGHNTAQVPPNEFSNLKRENEDLKIELARMKMRLREFEKPSADTPSSGSTPTHAGKPPLPRKSFINSVSKKLGRLYPFVRADGVRPSDGKGRTKAGKNRRHSIS
ncbi:hypothetical protein Scep_001135 [Stephania cephalantha]|uniref:Uncharacterized protein n=1 Tax=Stephania cephalantha TaxID=152367 RepID=A0AAP0LBG9_9MAGN